MRRLRAEAAEAALGQASQRLSDAAAPGEILITHKVRSEIGADYRTEQVGELDLKGVAHAQAAFRLVGNGAGPG